MSAAMHDDERVIDERDATRPPDRDRDLSWLRTLDDNATWGGV